jgi:hypothetical protein
MHVNQDAEKRFFLPAFVSCPKGRTVHVSLWSGPGGLVMISKSVSVTQKLCLCWQLLHFICDHETRETNRKPSPLKSCLESASSLGCHWLLLPFPLPAPPATLKLCFCGFNKTSVGWMNPQTSWFQKRRQKNNDNQNNSFHFGSSL